MRALVILPRSRHGVLTTLARGLCAAFATRGHEAALVDAAADPEALRRSLAPRGTQAVISFGSFAAEARLADGRSLYDAYDAAFVGWDVDHPFWQPERCAKGPARRIAVCAAPAHLRAGRLLGRRSLEVLSLPGVGATPPRPKPLKERPHALALALSWNGAPNAFWAQGAAGPAGALVKRVVERLLDAADPDPLAAFEGAQRDLGLTAPLDANVCALLANALLYVRQTETVRLLDALRRWDGPLLLIGSGWAERLQGARRITVLEDAPFESLAEAYESAQRVINLNGANGASERALGGLSVGALVLSDQAPLLEAAFGATGALRLFDRRRPDTLIEALETDLPPSEAQDRADAGRAEVDRAHLWSHRVALLEEALARLAP